MANKLNVGIIGYGYASKTFHAPLITTTEGLNLSAISSSDENKVKQDFPHITVYADPQALINDPSIDLIIIPTPNNTHYSLASQALEKGKHVVIDKPFTLTLEEAEKLSQQATNAGKLLSVFHNRRWDSGFLTVKKLLADKTLGEISAYEAHFDRFRPTVRQRWREDAGIGGGLWYDLAPHVIDQAVRLFGEPKAITADIAQLRPNAKNADYFHALLEYDNLRVILHASMLVASPTPIFAIHGTKGSYVKYGLDTQEDALKAGYLPNQTYNWGMDNKDGELTTLSASGELETTTLATLPGNYPAYYQQIYRAITLGEENPVTPIQATAIMRLIEAGEISNRLKQTITL
ncbi:oxidoreductase [Proteus vulgaris]|uniref:oxidoreductase n=1 Tax=Proteus vulgaris TaxID=585 RepID=UPI001B364CF4|nr:oxidoreductase [Proteus vulgaris]MBQ0212956.1 oxidoreductase [Proteus vulgaris]